MLGAGEVLDGRCGDGDDEKYADVMTSMVCCRCSSSRLLQLDDAECRTTGIAKDAASDEVASDHAG